MGTLADSLFWEVETGYNNGSSDSSGGGGQGINGRENEDEPRSLWDRIESNLQRQEVRTLPKLLLGTAYYWRPLCRHSLIVAYGTRVSLQGDAEYWDGIRPSH